MKGQRKIANIAAINQVSEYREYHFQEDFLPTKKITQNLVKTLIKTCRYDSTEAEESETRLIKNIFQNFFKNKIKDVARIQEQADKRMEQLDSIYGATTDPVAKENIKEKILDVNSFGDEIFHITHICEKALRGWIQSNNIQTHSKEKEEVEKRRIYLMIRSEKITTYMQNPKQEVDDEDENF